MLAKAKRAVTRISSCCVNAISRWGIQQLGSSLGCVFHLFAVKLVVRHAHGSEGKSVAPSPQTQVTVL